MNKILVVIVAALIIFVFGQTVEGKPYIGGTYRSIFIGSENVTASLTYETLTLIEGSGMSITPNFLTNEITFTSSGGSNPSELYCSGTDKFSSYNSTTNTFGCSTDIGGGSSALDDLTDVIITSPAYLSTLFYNGVEWIDKIFSINSITCGAGQFVNSIDNQTGVTACGSPTGSGFTNIASAPQTTATILASNSSSTATIKTLTQGQGITLTNGSSAVTVATNFKTNTLTCGSTDKFSAYDNSTGLFTCSADQAGSGGGVTTLSGGNLTSASTASYTTIFTIPLTASSGNFVSAYLIADSEVGTAVQVNANVTGSGNHGTCRVFTPLTISTFETDVLQVGLGSPVDTGTTAWFTNNATAIEMQCAIQSNGSPGNLKINFQTEITNINARILPGSYYIKTP